MKLYQIKIRPLSPFGTSLKGDTLFGHFCWQAAYDPDLLQGGLARWLDNYPEKPFAVFSSAFFRLADSIAMPRPQTPLAWLDCGPAPIGRRETIERRKHQKGLKWLLVDADLVLRLDADRLIDERELFLRFCAGLPDSQRRLLSGNDCERVGLLEHRSHNSINRLTGTTGSEGGFAPYQCEDICWPPGAELVVFVLVDEAALDAESLETGLSRIGDFGFGRDAGSGCGRFEVLGVEEVDIPDRTGANACYTLAPSVPETGLYRRKFFTPFIRFGRHGDRLARSRNPFKAPVVMADEGAVFIPKDSGQLSRPWLGRAVKGLSLAQPEAVGQGYTIYLPCEVAV